MRRCSQIEEVGPEFNLRLEKQATLSDYQRFLRLHRKMIIKINNLRLKRSKRRHPGGRDARMKELHGLCQARPQDRLSESFSLLEHFRNVERFGGVPSGCGKTGKSGPKRCQHVHVRQALLTSIRDQQGRWHVHVHDSYDTVLGESS